MFSQHPIARSGGQIVRFFHKRKHGSDVRRPFREVNVVIFSTALTARTHGSTI
jgi:hypothetical protein